MPPKKINPQTHEENPETTAAPEEYPAPATALTPDKQPQTVAMTPAQIQTAEAEKAALLDAMCIPAKPPTTARAFAQTRLERQRVTGQLDPVVVKEKLDATTAALQEKEAKLTAATERDRLAAEQREQELQAVRMEVGQAQQEQAAVQQAQIGPAMAARVERYQAASVSNVSVEATEDAAYRARWIAEARPLIAKVEAFLKELYPFADTNLPSLRALAKLTWQDAPVTWAVQYRTQLADRAVNPSKELIGDITGAQAAAEESLARAEQVIAGHAKPTSQIIERLANAANFSVENYRSRLGVLDHELKRVEVRGEASVKKDFIPTVTISRREPLGGGAESGAAPIQTEWKR